MKRKPQHHTASIMHSQGLTARASTNYPVNMPEFMTHQGNFGYNPMNYKGPGYVVRPGFASQRARPQVQGVRSQASSGGGGWRTNTELELEQIVYPDGVRKNASQVQQELSQEQQQAQARKRIEQLMQSNSPEALKEIEMLQHKFFPSEILAAEARAQKEESKKIHITAEGHAKQAEESRQAILKELEALTGGGGLEDLPSYSSATVDGKDESVVTKLFPDESKIETFDDLKTYAEGIDIATISSGSSVTQKNGAFVSQLLKEGITDPDVIDEILRLNGSISKVAGNVAIQARAIHYAEQVQKGSKLTKFATKKKR